MKSTTRNQLCVALGGLSILVASLSLPTGGTTEAMAQNGDQLQGTVNASDALSESNARPIAVIELFTSEGCSSCPPADANLQRISMMKPTSDGIVIPLSFHVDYWNYLGWEDPFSQKAFTERQQDYARGSKQQGVYTPQMVVNGKYAFNGADAALSDKAIELSLHRPVTHVVELNVVKSSTEDKFEAKYSVRPAHTDSGKDSSVETQNRVPAADDATSEAGTDFQINFAVASQSESVKVVRGENGGRELSHAWVVKHFDVRPMNSKSRTFQFDASTVTSGKTRVVAYVQSNTSREITGAVAIEL